MSLRYVNALKFTFVIMLGGCASAPQEPAMVPVSGTTAVETAAVIDVEGEFQAALKLMKAEDWHVAADRLAAITAAKPLLSGPWTNLGIARNKIGDTAGAEAAFINAIDANSRQIVAYNELGILYRRSGRLEEAASMYNQGLKINPNDERIHWNLGILNDRYLSNPAQALIHYQHYQQLTQSQDGQLLSWINKLRDQVSQNNVATGANR
jgi:tetratricopeptide (TPR) repeat protein